jgi:hypothetical protein
MPAAAADVIVAFTISPTQASVCGTASVRLWLGSEVTEDTSPNSFTTKSFGAAPSCWFQVSTSARSFSSADAGRL